MDHRKTGAKQAVTGCVSLGLTQGKYEVPWQPDPVVEVRGGGSHQFSLQCLSLVFTFIEDSPQVLTS